MAGFIEKDMTEVPSRNPDVITDTAGYASRHDYSEPLQYCDRRHGEMTVKGFDGELIKLVWDEVFIPRGCIEPEENIFPEFFEP